MQKFCDRCNARLGDDVITIIDENIIPVFFCSWSCVGTFAILKQV